jgi:hypothetical protein
MTSPGAMIPGTTMAVFQGIAERNRAVVGGQRRPVRLPSLQRACSVVSDVRTACPPYIIVRTSPTAAPNHSATWASAEI